MGNSAYARNARQAFVIAIPQAFANAPPFLDIRQLREAQRREEIEHMVLISALNQAIRSRVRLSVALPNLFGEAVQRKTARALGQVGAHGGKHAAFARGDVFGGVETKHREIADRTDLLVAPRGFYRVRGVFDNREVVFARDRAQAIHVGALAVEMHRHERLGARRDGTFRRVGIEKVRCSIHVGEDRRCARVFDFIRRGAVGDRRGDHLVARPYAERDQRQMQAGGG